MNAYESNIGSTKKLPQEVQDLCVEIVMSNESGKWKALETDNTTYHECRLQSQNPPTIEQVIHYKANEQQSETLALTAALRELAHGINTMVISSLAVDEDSRKWCSVSPIRNH